MVSEEFNTVSKIPFGYVTNPWLNRPTLVITCYNTYIYTYIYIHTHLLYPPAGNHNIWFIPGRSSHSPRVRRPAALAAEGRTGALRLAGIRQPFFWDVDVEMEKRWENPRKMDPAMDVSENWIYPMIAYDRPFNGKLIKLLINQLMKLDTRFLDKPNFFHGFPHVNFAGGFWRAIPRNSNKCADPFDCSKEPPCFCFWCKCNKSLDVKGLPYFQ